jgi:hypothetical protein
MSAAIILAIRLGEHLGWNTRDDDEADAALLVAAEPKSITPSSEGE